MSRTIVHHANILWSLILCAYPLHRHAGKELETLRRRIEGRKEMLHVAADACIEAHSLSQDGSSSEDDERRVSKSGPSAFLPLLPGSSVMHQASQDLPTSPVVANVSPSGKAAPSGFVVPKLDLKSVSPGGHTNTSTAGNTPSSREAAGSSLAAGTPHDTVRAPWEMWIGSVDWARACISACVSLGRAPYGLVFGALAHCRVVCSPCPASGSAV